MTINELYKTLGGNYEEVLNRLHNEALIIKLIKMFPEDENYRALLNALDSGRIKEAFLAAHTLKGLCLSLGFTTLARSASQVTEALRNGRNDVTSQMLDSLSSDYSLAVFAAGKFSEDN